jgi:hypothetical protein
MGNKGIAKALCDQEKMRDVFKKYDGDKSNSIEIQELEKMIDDLFTELSKDPEMKKKKMYKLFPCDINYDFECWSTDGFKRTFRPRVWTSLIP